MAQDEFFFAEQNVRLVKNAEEYYRTMFRGRVESWNLRDRHMAETLDALVAHLNAQGQEARVAVWEHNSHLGESTHCCPVPFTGLIDDEIWFLYPLAIVALFAPHAPHGLVFPQRRGHGEVEEIINRDSGPGWDQVVAWVVVASEDSHA